MFPRIIFLWWKYDYTARIRLWCRILGNHMKYAYDVVTRFNKEVPPKKCFRIIDSPGVNTVKLRT